MCAEQRNSRVFDAHFGDPETTQNLTTIYARPTTKSVLGENGYHHMCTQHRERGDMPIHFTVTSMPGRHSPPNSVRPCLEDRLNSTSVNFETHQAAHLVLSASSLRHVIRSHLSGIGLHLMQTKEAHLPRYYHLPLHRSMGGLVAALIMFHNMSSEDLAETRRLCTCFRTG